MRFFVLFFKSSCLILSSHCLISSILFFISLVLISFQKISSIYSMSSLFSSDFKAFEVSTCFKPLKKFIYFSSALLSEEYINAACSIVLVWSDGIISSPVRNSYWSILPDGNADIFVPSLLISYYTFSPLIFWSIVIISFYFPSKRFFWKVKNYLVQE